MKKLVSILTAGMISFGSLVSGDGFPLVKVRVCEGEYPQTYIIKNDSTTYGVNNISYNIKIMKPSCYPINRDPITIDSDTGNRTEQNCRWALPNEKLNWSKADIKPEDIIFKKDKNGEKTPYIKHNKILVKVGNYK